MTTAVSQASTTSTTSSSSAPACAAVQEVQPRDVLRWLKSGECVLIDVREPDEHARERIAGAKLLPLSRFDPNQAESLANVSQTIVLHCKGGKRSADACRLAASLVGSGRTVLSMCGGIEGWKKDALPVDVNTKVSGISVMRQVQLVIGVCVLAGSALAWFVDPRYVALPAFFGAGLAFAGATGTCALASIIGWMPWNRAGARDGAACGAKSCM